MLKQLLKERWVAVGVREDNVVITILLGARVVICFPSGILWEKQGKGGGQKRGEREVSK